MAETFAVKLEGEKELLQALRELPDNVSKRIMRRAIVRASEPILQAAKNNVPVRTGALKKALDTKFKFYKKSKTWVAIIGARTDVEFIVQAKDSEGKPIGKPQKIKPSKYMHLAEYGTAPHALGKDSERILSSSRKRGGTTPGKQGGRMHPGTTGSAFMRKAYAANQSEASRIIEEELRGGIEREAKRTAQRTKHLERGGL